MPNEDAIRMLREQPRIFWGHVVRVMIERGWSPPPPDERIVDALLAEMEQWGRPQDLDFDDASERLKALTPSEARIAQLVAMGLGNPEISERLGIAHGTVKFHLTNVYRKLGIETRTQLAIMARGE